MNRVVDYIKNWSKTIDWSLLIFLILIMNVKLVVKLAAILFICIFYLRPRHVMGWTKKSLPLFYTAMLGYMVFQFLLSLPHQQNYLPVFLTAFLYWFICLIVFIILRAFIDEKDQRVIHNTLVSFFVLNFAFCFANLLLIILETGALNPYRYQGMNQKYFIGTGDAIKGISFNTSTTNAVINALALIYFMYRKKVLLSVLSLICLLLTGSNFVNLVIVIVLLGIFIFWGTKFRRSMIVGCLAGLICFVVKISPENSNYFMSFFQKLTGKKEGQESAVKYYRLEDTPDSLLNKEDKKIKSVKLLLDSVSLERRKSLPSLPATRTSNEIVVNNKGEKINIDSVVKGPDIHSEPFQRKTDTTQKQRVLSMEAVIVYKDSAILRSDSLYDKMPGKALAYRQTKDYVTSGPKAFLLGAGPGNFSSKLAFRVSSLATAEGGWPKKFVYLNEDFKNNHLKIFLYYFIKDESRHSVTNLPNSTYNQLLGEYGIIGVLLFVFLYLFDFLRRYKKLSYGLPMLLLLVGIFNIEYWFEQLSVMILLECLLLADLKNDMKKYE